METELLALFIFHSLGVAVFGRFESETPWWRLVIKWAVMLGLTWWLSVSFGTAVALSVMAALLVASLTFHFVWCKRHGIHPISATPRKRYYELRGWDWKE